jgi:2-polyprenyl-3-methyl-5-hydroxy-6-metoxy-1,4-benzoquinol methylase
MMEEAEKIKGRYEKRRNNEVGKNENSVFIENVVKERETVYSKILKEHFSEIDKVKFIEIGAGEGANIDFFRSLGIKDENIVAAELLPERTAKLRKKYPKITVSEGDALQLQFENKFDVVFQSLVFTSILDTDFKKKLATKMWSLLKPEGFILWYDFKFNNPANTDVKGVGKAEIKELFPAVNEIVFYNVTLAPPVGRRVGSMYEFVNSVFPFLRTHLIAVIKK